MTHRVKTLIVAGLIATNIMPAKAADPGYCHAYANLAVAQYQMGLAKGIANLGFPRWHNNANGHRDWCLLPFVTRHAADGETSFRQSVIN